MTVGAASSGVVLDAVSGEKSVSGFMGEGLSEGSPIFSPFKQQNGAPHLENSNDHKVYAGDKRKKDMVLVKLLPPKEPKRMLLTAVEMILTLMKRWRKAASLECKLNMKNYKMLNMI